MFYRQIYEHFFICANFFSTCFLPVVGLCHCPPCRHETHPLADRGTNECAKCASVRFWKPSSIFRPLQAQVCKCAKVCAKCALFRPSYNIDYVRITKSVQSVRTFAHSFLHFFNSIPLEKVFIKKRYYYMSARWLFLPLLRCPFPLPLYTRTRLHLS